MSVNCQHVDICKLMTMHLKYFQSNSFLQINNEMFNSYISNVLKTKRAKYMVGILRLDEIPYIFSKLQLNFQV